MVILENVRKCVVFVGYKMASGEMILAGSAFYLGRESAGGKAERVVLVTAKHVIDGIRDLGLDEVYIRANTKAGEAVWLMSKLDTWKFHPSDSTVDVAFRPSSIPDEFDHLVIPTSKCVTEKVLLDNSVALGDEVFVTGLFRHHHGTKRNIPIVRVGNLAALSEEKVATKKYGLIDAYLIEARSIGGISGSPVFLNLGVTRYVDKQVKLSTGGSICFLLGLIHGHYDIDDRESGGQRLSIETINSGIAIVVPMHKIFETVGIEP